MGAGAGDWQWGQEETWSLHHLVLHLVKELEVAVEEEEEHYWQQKEAVQGVAGQAQVAGLDPMADQVFGGFEPRPELGRLAQENPTTTIADLHRCVDHSRRLLKSFLFVPSSKNASGDLPGVLTITRGWSSLKLLRPTKIEKRKRENWPKHQKDKHRTADLLEQGR